MANFGKFKNLGTPPSEDEASPNLSAPEVAPASAEELPASATPSPQTEVRIEKAPREYRREVDGRSARRTNRTVQFATRVTPEFDERIRQIAQRDNLLLVEVMERALDSYEKNGN